MKALGKKPDTTKKYTILAMFPKADDHAWHSVVCQSDDQDYWLYCRGDTDALLDRATFEVEEQRGETRRTFNSLVEKGNRMAVFCYKPITQEIA